MKKLPAYGAFLLLVSLVTKTAVVEAIYVLPEAQSALVGAKTMVTDAAILVGVFFVLLLVPRTWVRFGIVAGGNLALTVLLFGNLVHDNMFGDFIAVHEFQMAGMVDDAEGAVGVLIRPAYFLLFVDLAALAVVAASRIEALRLRSAARAVARRLAGSPPGSFGAAVASVAGKTAGAVRRAAEAARAKLIGSPRAFPARILAYCVLVALAVQWLWRPNETAVPFSTKEVFTRDSMLAYYAKGSLLAVTGSQGPAVKSDLREEICTCGGEDFAAEVRKALPEGTKPNFFLLQIESLNTEALTPAVMPNLCKLRDRSLFFDNFHAFGYLALTFRGEYTVYTMLYPPRGSRVTYTKGGWVVEKSLLEYLKEAGYDTWFFHGYYSEFYNRRWNYEGWGMEHFYSQDELSRLGVPPGDGYGGGPYGPGIDDATMPPVVAELLSKARRPFLAHYITLTSHFPYKLPGEEYEIDEMVPGDEESYFRMMRYVDRALGVLLDELQRRGLLENTYLAVYADHRGRTRLSDSYGRAIGEKQPERIVEFVGQHHIPAMIAGPGIAPGHLPVEGSHVDVGPTILALAGIERPKEAMGRSLLTRCTCRLWAAPSLVGPYVFKGPGYFGCQDQASGRLAVYSSQDRSPVGLSPGLRDQIEAALSRLAYSDRAYVHEPERLQVYRRPGYWEDHPDEALKICKEAGLTPEQLEMLQEQFLRGVEKVELRLLHPARVGQRAPVPPSDSGEPDGTPEEQ